MKPVQEPRRINRPEFEQIIRKDLEDLLVAEDENIVRDVIDMTFKIIGEALAENKEVRLSDFGRFYRSTRQRAHRNPSTNEVLGTNTEHYFMFAPYSAAVRVLDE